MCFCLILLPNFECAEVNLSFNFLYSFLNMSHLHERTFSVPNIKLLVIMQVSIINLLHDVIPNVTSLPGKDSNKSIDLHKFLAFYLPFCKVIINFSYKITENCEQYCWKVEHVQHYPQYCWQYCQQYC